MHNPFALGFALFDMLTVDLPWAVIGLPENPNRAAKVTLYGEELDVIHSNSLAVECHRISVWLENFIDE